MKTVKGVWVLSSVTKRSGMTYLVDDLISHNATNTTTLCETINQKLTEN